MLAGVAVTTAAMATTLLVGPVSATAGTSVSGKTISYTVVLEQGATRTAAVSAVKAAGGTVTGTNRAARTLTVKAPAKGFVVAVSKSRAVLGAAKNQAIGKAPDMNRRDLVEKAAHVDGAKAAGQKAAEEAGTVTAAATAGMDPLDTKLWGLRMVKSDQARAIQSGDDRVLVGVLDTGVDARHPDIAPNFDAARSRNFTTDQADIDGATCEFPALGCKDPADWDDNGHGTHTAGTMAAAANGFGISGVAPDVTLVNIRGGQDSGYFFLGPVVNALTYAGDAGLDVVNMSFYVDPWLYNCTANPRDSAEAQIEQRAIIAAMGNALDYAHSKGVTLVGSLGNDHDDIGNPRPDTSSPDYPGGTEYTRPVDNATCFDLPVEGPHVIGVSALGPSGDKADYSNYGIDGDRGVDVAAPGGWFRDGYGTATFRTNENLILSTAPVNALQDSGEVDADGNITPLGEEFGVIKQCPAGSTSYVQCGYYQYLQGTSMAGPHAAGVAALIVSQYGSVSGTGFGLAADTTKSILLQTADEHACPFPRMQTYTREGRSGQFNALCTGTEEFNDFYGHGIVDALAAVTAD